MSTSNAIFTTQLYTNGPTPRRRSTRALSQSRRQNKDAMSYTPSSADEEEQIDGLSDVSSPARNTRQQVHRRRQGHSLGSQPASHPDPSDSIASVSSLGEDGPDDDIYEERSVSPASTMVRSPQGSPTRYLPLKNTVSESAPTSNPHDAESSGAGENLVRQDSLLFQLPTIALRTTGVPKLISGMFKADLKTWAFVLMRWSRWLAVSTIIIFFAFIGTLGFFSAFSMDSFFMFSLGTVFSSVGIWVDPPRFAFGALISCFFLRIMPGFTRHLCMRCAQMFQAGNAYFYATLSS